MTATQAVVPVQMMARAMGVPRSGFDAWSIRLPSARAMADEGLTNRIGKVHSASKETYGAPRIHAERADDGVNVGRKRVERLIKAAALAGVSRRKGTRVPRSSDDRVQPANDLVDRKSGRTRRTSTWRQTLPTFQRGRASSICLSC